MRFPTPATDADTGTETSDDDTGIVWDTVSDEMLDMGALPDTETTMEVEDSDARSHGDYSVGDAPGAHSDAPVSVTSLLRTQTDLHGGFRIL